MIEIETILIALATLVGGILATYAKLKPYIEKGIMKIKALNVVVNESEKAEASLDAAWAEWQTAWEDKTLTPEEIERLMPKLQTAMAAATPVYNSLKDLIRDP